MASGLAAGATSALGEAKLVIYNGVDATLETAGEFEAAMALLTYSPRSTAMARQEAAAAAAAAAAHEAAMEAAAAAAAEGSNNPSASPKPMAVH